MTLICAPLFLCFCSDLCKLDFCLSLHLLIFCLSFLGMSFLSFLSNVCCSLTYSATSSSSNLYPLLPPSKLESILILAPSSLILPKNAGKLLPTVILKAILGLIYFKSIQVNQFVFICICMCIMCICMLSCASDHVICVVHSGRFPNKCHS